jgi:hypothetical protein
MPETEPHFLQRSSSSLATMVSYPSPKRLQWSSGLVVSMLASGTQVQTRLFSGEKILSMPSFGGEVKSSVPCRRFAACKRSLHFPWKSYVVGKIESAISCPYFPPSLMEVSHDTGCGAPLGMTRKTKSSAQRTNS